MFLNTQNNWKSGKRNRNRTVLVQVIDVFWDFTSKHLRPTGSNCRQPFTEKYWSLGFTWFYPNKMGYRLYRYLPVSKHGKISNSTVDVFPIVFPSVWHFISRGFPVATFDYRRVFRIFRIGALGVLRMRALNTAWLNLEITMKCMTHDTSFSVLAVCAEQNLTSSNMAVVIFNR